jgi:hypothetical protein
VTLAFAPNSRVALSPTSISQNSPQPIDADWRKEQIKFCRALWSNGDACSTNDAFITFNRNLIFHLRVAWAGFLSLNLISILILSYGSRALANFLANDKPKHVKPAGSGQVGSGLLCSRLIYEKQWKTTVDERLVEEVVRNWFQ